MCVNKYERWIVQPGRQERVTLACGKCWQCRENKLTDLMGRALAEASTAQGTAALTLTYRDPDEGLPHRVITPPHFQRFVRALRRSGHLVRYYVAGEYGEAKGRAHFHAILFFHSPAPRWPQRENFWIDEWPHGHVFCDWAADDRAVSYVARYMRQDFSWWSLSKKPPIGWPFFQRQAQRYVSQGLVPTDFIYRPPGGRRRAGYWLDGATRRDFLLCIADGYDQAGRAMPSMAEHVEAALDAALLWRAKRDPGYRAPWELWNEAQAALAQEVMDRNRSMRYG